MYNIMQSNYTILKRGIAFCVVLCYCFHCSDACQCAEKNHLRSCFCEDPNVATFKDLAVIYPTLCHANSTIDSLTLNRMQKFQIISDNSSAVCNLNGMTSLSLSETGLNRLFPSSFEAFPNLKWLNLSNNSKLTSYGDEAFLSIGNSLSTLVAVSNPVRSLTRGVFKGMQGLTRLILSDNKIGYLEPGLFTDKCCGNIRELKLDRNILTVLNANSFIGLSRLEILDLRDNPIQMLESGVFQPFASTLLDLRLSYKNQAPFGGFRSPAAGLFSNLTQLKVLHLEELKISNVSSETFRDLQNLQSLSLRGNRLEQLPSNVLTTLKRLERLDLSSNWLVCIASSLNPNDPVDFLSGLNLNWVDLSWNRLTHLNHLTARSLGLFDYQSLTAQPFVLNLTGNPWQHIDEDTFCGPTVVRSTNLILGPLPPVVVSLWRTSLGLWNARARWPRGPLSLIGKNSRIYGLMLTDAENSVLSGLANSSQLCHKLRTVGHLDEPNTNHSNDFGVKRVPATRIAFSLSSHCPSLPIRTLSDFELTRFNLTDIIVVSPLRSFERGSRLYLLVIAAICVSFLLVALTVIMCYRAWSRRITQKTGDHDLNGSPTGFTMDASAEKHLLLRPQQYPSGQNYALPQNGKIDNGLTEKSANFLTQPTVTGDNVPTSIQNSTIVVAPAAIRCAVRNGRPKSDSDAAELDETERLIALGVV